MKSAGLTVACWMGAGSTIWTGELINRKGYMSLTHGQPPVVHVFDSFAKEISFLKLLPAWHMLPVLFIFRADFFKNVAAVGD